MLVDKHFGVIRHEVYVSSYSFQCLTVCGGHFVFTKGWMIVVSAKQNFQISKRLFGSHSNCRWTVSLGFIDVNFEKSTKINFQRLKLDQFRSFAISQVRQIANTTPYVPKIDSYSTLKRFARDCLANKERFEKSKSHSISFLPPSWLDLIMSHTDGETNCKQTRKKRSTEIIKHENWLRSSFKGRIESLSRGMRGIMAKVAHWIKS